MIAQREARVAGNMLVLFFSLVMLYAAATVIGFALGWRLYAFLNAERRDYEEREVEHLRAALGEAQVRRARAP
ncbi:MAG TPA: hypothetical protein DHW63_05060 [Hyphomonadaceae bacterium]|nr:hypothetical protein [Hyphomonadaceae bacterium]